MVDVLFISNTETLDFIFLLNTDDVVLLFKLKVDQYSCKAFTRSVNTINQLGIDMAGRGLIRNAKYPNISVINEAAETRAIPH